MSPLQLHINVPEPDVFEQKIFDILLDTFQTQSKSITAGARDIDALLRTSLEENTSPEGLLWEAWNVIIKTAEQISHIDPTQDRLVELIKHLRDLPPRTVIVWSSECKIWTDLPLLGASFAEELESINITREVPLTKRETSITERRQWWRNLNAFTARLTNDGILNCKIYAIYALRDALEGQLAHRHSSRVSTDLLAIPALDCRVAVAADWILRYGRVLFDHHEDLGEVAPGPLWKGKSGSFLDRWQLWKQRFGEIGEHDKIDAETRRLAGEGKSAMEVVEMTPKECLEIDLSLRHMF